MICLHCLNWEQSNSIPLVEQHGRDVTRGSGDADVRMPFGDVAASIAEIVERLRKRAGEIVNIEELKTHIHSELFGDRFPTSIPISEWKDQHKKTVMRRSVKVMLYHEQSDKEIVQMLKDKFFLTEQQAQEFIENEVSNSRGIKEDKE